VYEKRNEKLEKAALEKLEKKEKTSICIPAKFICMQKNNV
jgi:hypothetical protein